MIKLPWPGGEAERLRCERLKKFRRDLKNVHADLVLLLHEEAEEHPKGSEERLASLEFAHEIYLEGRKKRRGRPEKDEGALDDDAPTLAWMHYLSHKTGETCARKLARLVVDSVPNAVSEKSRIERLARKYTKRRDKMEWHGSNMRLCEPDDPEFADDNRRDAEDQTSSYGRLDVKPVK